MWILRQLSGTDYLGNSASKPEMIQGEWPPDHLEGRIIHHSKNTAAPQCSTYGRLLMALLSYVLAVHVGHVRSESQSVQYVPFDIWTSCTQYKHIKLKVHSFKYGTSVREKINCKIIDKYLRCEYTL